VNAPEIRKKSGELGVPTPAGEIQGGAGVLRQPVAKGNFLEGQGWGKGLAPGRKGDEWTTRLHTHRRGFGGGCWASFQFL